MLDAHTKIRQLRTMKGFSQDYVAAELNLSTRAYGNIESGETQLTFERFEKICGILEVDPMKALGFDEKFIFEQCHDLHYTGINHHYSNPKERELYENRISHLEGEVNYLRLQLEKLLSSNQ